MNSELEAETAHMECTASREEKLDVLLNHIEQHVRADRGEQLTIEGITKETHLTSEELVKIGAHPSNLIYLLAHRLNQRMVEKFSSTYLFALGFTSIERIGKYLLLLLDFDIENIKLRGAIHQYSWSFSAEQERLINSQSLKLMAPLHLEFIENQFSTPDARCQAIWSLYTHALRLSAIRGASAQDCLKEIWDSVQLICNS